MAASLVERVRALQGGLPLDEAAVKERRADIASGTAITADNLAERLNQAVVASDDAVLDACLTAPVGHAAIRAAASQLRPQVAEAALAAAFARFRRRPGRGEQLAIWMRALLMSHAAHLQASPDAAPLLGALQGGVGAAAAAQGPLLALQGRLQLALAQQPPLGEEKRPETLQFAEDDALQPEPVAADALVNLPRAEAEEGDEESSGGEDAAAWASDSSSEGEGSEEEEGSEDEMSEG